MKFRYLFIILILTLPVIKVVKDYQYSKTVNKEEINFRIKVWDFGDNDNLKTVDTLIVTLSFDLPKTYTLKKYAYYGSDCMTCDSQGYIFYRNPSKETINEPDSLKFGWITKVEKDRSVDSVKFSIITFNDMFLSNLSLHNEMAETHSQLIAMLKSEVSDCVILQNNFFENFSQLSVEYDLTINHYSFLTKFSLIKFIMQDKTKKNINSQDFYKILQSVKIKVEYNGKNEKLTKLVNSY